MDKERKLEVKFRYNEIKWTFLFVRDMNTADFPLPAMLTYVNDVENRL